MVDAFISWILGPSNPSSQGSRDEKQVLLGKIVMGPIPQSPHCFFVMCFLYSGYGASFNGAWSESQSLYRKLTLFFKGFFQSELKETESIQDAKRLWIPQISVGRKQVERATHVQT